ncbi:hypothetical protein HID58_058008 [Brassica napus]|uniref:Uncharacterized protein n=1 Tax=Brassica napus TaxID=3708 RepID=A0ABQ7ZNU8_BRANA|nr:hypothetical protein HID58_058008 [Brassica napus]
MRNGEMDRRRRRHSKAKASCSEEVSSIEWEAVKMSEEEEDLISRMYKLVGDSIILLDRNMTMSGLSVDSDCLANTHSYL